MNEVMISVEVATAQLAQLVEQIHARGHTVVLTQNGRPLARLVPLRQLPTRDDLSDFLNTSGSAPPLPEALIPPPLPQAHRPPRPPLEAQAAARLRAEAHHYSKKSRPSAQLLFSIGMAVLAGVMVILLVALIVRSAMIPGPAFKQPEQKSRPAVRDTSRAAPREWRYLAS